MISLALKYRPSHLEEMVGQEHLLALHVPFRKMLERGVLPHSFFYGPPGCGKTTLARIVARMLERPYHEFNATTFKIDDLRKLCKKYEGTLQAPLIFMRV